MEQKKNTAASNETDALNMESFSKVEYHRPDMGALKKKLKSLLRALKKAKTYEEARAVYLSSQ